MSKRGGGGGRGRTARGFVMMVDTLEKAGREGSVVWARSNGCCEEAEGV